MSAVSALLDAGRRMAESLMLDTCTVKTPTGTSTNETTGVVTATYTNVYTGMCKVQSPGAHVNPQSNPEVSGATFTVLRSEVHVPVSAFTPAVGQVVTLTAVPLDALLVGRVFRVVAMLHKSQATAYRLGVDEIV